VEMATLTSKGQLTVPKKVRDRLGLQPGDKVVFDLDEESVRLRVIKNQSVEQLFHRLQGSQVPYPGRGAERQAARRAVVEDLVGE
jgi:AbrB family looped-hinge helix DNA binding protein